MSLPKQTAVGLVAALCAYLFLAGQVNKDLTPEDVAAIKLLDVDSQCGRVSSFGEEVHCAQAIQASIKGLVTETRCAAPGTRIEPSDFLKRGFGCCYDRARFTEKALAHYGFRTRHVAIYNLTDLGLVGLLSSGTPSHATSEVLTSKGWMGVDSNEYFVLLTEDEKPLSFRDLRANRAELGYQPMPATFYSGDLFVIYGLYSRHGRFHGPDLPAPEFNLQELFHNF